MPKSPKKSSKSPSKPTKTPSKSKSKSTADVKENDPSTPFSDASNLANSQLPTTTPRVFDFALALPDSENAAGDGWSSDDSFEEKITWSRHRMRVTPGGFTPRNIQEVRRRLNLAELPEDKSSNTVVKPIVLKNQESSKRPCTPIKSFREKDPSIMPPTPSPKKVMPSAIPTKVSLSGASPTKIPIKSVKEGSRDPIITAAKTGSKTSRHSTSARQPVTQVKEFRFASDARSRRTPGNPNATAGKKETEIFSTSSQQHDQPKIAETGMPEADQRDESVDNEADEGLALRMRAYEVGKASILAWGETQGRYLN